MQRTIVALAFAFAMTASDAWSATITENVGPNTSTDSAFIGQSITTPAGGPWNNLTYNLFDINGNASAFGTLYLLNAEYLGTPNALSSATPGFLASTSTISNGIWQFASGVTVNSSTQYFLYTADLNNILRQNTTGVYAGGIAYYSLSAASNYVTDATSDTLFNFSGTPITRGSDVPEPGTFALLGAGVGMLVLMRRRS